MTTCGVVRLDPDHESALEAMLRTDVATNLFLLGHLRVHPVDRSVWMGALREGQLSGACLVIPGRLAVPCFQSTDDAEAVGRALRHEQAPNMVVGARAACDALWRGWGSPRARVWYDQRLYVAHRAPTPGPSAPVLRRARLSEVEQIAMHSGQMEEEDLGKNTYLSDREAQLRATRDRIHAGRTWVIDHMGQLVFQIHVGTQLAEGCQVGGTWVPPAFRGQGWATAGMRALLRELLRKSAMVTLHVNEANEPAVRCYERSGFARAAAYRLAAV